MASKPAILLRSINAQSGPFAVDGFITGTPADESVALTMFIGT